MDTWRYRESWTRLPARAPDPGRWLAVLPPGPAGDWTGAVLAALGPDVVTVECDGDRAALAARLAERAPAGLAGVVSLAAAADPAVPEPAVPAGLAATVRIVQALGDAGIAAPLWCLTRGAVSVGAGDPVTRPAQAALWGLGRAAALELPRRWGGLVDLPETADERIATVLPAVLAGGEDQVAVRAAGVYGRRLVRASAGGAAAKRWRARGTVLITGGTGGVGGHVARWAAAEGAEHIVLVGRRGAAAPGAAELSEELAGFGARVTVAACDAADREALASVLADIPAGLPLTTVVHAAGAGDGDAPVESLTEALLDPILRPKLTAAWHLHELTRELDLDAFVLFSSGAGSWGSGGRPGYSAANAFLDGLAQYRRGLGLAATSIAWGAWDGAGMGAADPEALARFRRRGVLPMAPELAVGALRQALDEDQATLTVTSTDWSRFAPSFTAERPSPLLGELPEARAALDRGPEPDAGGDLRRRLTELPAEGRERLLHDLVRAESAAVLGYDRPEQVAADQVFRDQGFDSVTAVEMRERLRAATGLAIPSGLVFDYPTPRAVAGYLLGALLAGTAVPTGSLVDELARLEAALEGSTVDELQRPDVAQRLERLLSRLRPNALPAMGRSSEAEIESAPVDELLDIIDAELFDRS